MLGYQQCLRFMYVPSHQAFNITTIETKPIQDMVKDNSELYSDNSNLKWQVTLVKCHFQQEA